MERGLLHWNYVSWSKDILLPPFSFLEGVNIKKTEILLYTDCQMNNETTDPDL